MHDEFHLAHETEAGFSLDKDYHSVFVILSNQSVAFPMADDRTPVYAFIALLNAHTIRNFPTSLEPRAITLAAFFTAPPVLPQSASCRFVRIDKLVRGFVAYRVESLLSRPTAC